MLRHSVDSRFSARSSSCVGSRVATRPFTGTSMNRSSLRVVNAITRQKKEEIVSNLKSKLETSQIVFSIKYKNLSVPTVQRFRKGLPEGSSFVVTKNSLMKVACEQVPGWTGVIDKGCKGENGWVFVPEDVIPDTLKHYFKYESDLFEEAKKAAPKNVEVKKPTEVTCAVFDNKYLTSEELKQCEKLPTKKQLLATIASLAKQPAKKIATGIKMVPMKLAVAIKKVSELDEDQSKTVASFASS